MLEGGGLAEEVIRAPSDLLWKYSHNICQSDWESFVRQVSYLLNPHNFPHVTLRWVNLSDILARLCPCCWSVWVMMVVQV